MSAVYEVLFLMGAQGTMGGISYGYARTEKSQNKEARALYEMRKKALLDERSALDYAETRGREAGRTEEKKEIALGMLQKGLPISLIAEITRLSEAEIEALSKQMH